MMDVLCDNEDMHVYITSSPDFKSQIHLTSNLTYVNWYPVNVEDM